MYTFKAQDKSNAKRFLVKTCKLEAFNLYLTQHDGNWGTWLGADGKPVLAADVVISAAERTVPADVLPSPADTHAQAQASVTEDAPEPEPEDEPAAGPSASAFGAFAASQLGVKPEPVKPEAGPAESSSVKIEKDRPSANGITRPSAGTICASVWELAALLSDKLGRTVSLTVLIDAAKDQGINQYTARTQYACWRKFNGITGRVTK